MHIVIPMAGLGQRYKDAGFTLPKPLIPVRGVPMILRVLQDLPPAKQVVFVVHPAHVEEYAIDRLLQVACPGCVVEVAPGSTQGQACTVELGLKHVDPSDSVLIAACDNTHVYDQSDWFCAVQQPETEALIWTYRGEPAVLRKPNAYGWVDADPTGVVRAVSVKRPLSTQLLQDHVISGTFWFRHAGRLREFLGQLFAKNIRVNQEFYLDSVPPLYLEAGRLVRVFEVTRYIGWGTPEDLASYERGDATDGAHWEATAPMRSEAA